MKKSLIIMLVIIGILALGTGFYFAWQKSKQAAVSVLPSAPAGIGGGIQTAEPSASAASVSLVSKNAAVDYWIANVTSTATSTMATSTPINLIFYITTNGNIFRINRSNEEIVSDLQINNLRSVKSSADGKIILIKSGTSGNVRFDVFDSSRSIWLQPLLGAMAADISADGKRLVYLLDNGSKSATLMIQEVGASLKKKPSQIISINQTDFDLKWLDAETVVFIPKSSAEFGSEIWKINIKTKILSLLMSANGLILNWSKFGDTAVRFFSNSGRSNVFDFIDSKGAVRGIFQFKTMPDKCFISSPSQIYCAIPQDQDVFSRLTFPDDYFKRSVYFQDSIYLIDFAQNQFHLLFESGVTAMDAIKLSVLNNQLLFINRYDGKIYGLEIK